MLYVMILTFLRNRQSPQKAHTGHKWQSAASAQFLTALFGFKPGELSCHGHCLIYFVSAVATNISGGFNYCFVPRVVTGIFPSVFCNKLYKGVGIMVS